MLGDLSPSVRLATQPLSISITSISSEAADKATDNQWSATTGLPDDKLPEVPPDGEALQSLALRLSGPVWHVGIKALQLSSYLSTFSWLSVADARLESGPLGAHKH